MAATVRRKQFPRRCTASSRSKFSSPPGSPLRFDRKRCSQPVPRRPDHNKDAMGANLVQLSLLQNSHCRGDFSRLEATAEDAGGHFWHDAVIETKIITPAQWILPNVHCES